MYWDAVSSTYISVPSGGVSAETASSTAEITDTPKSVPSKEEKSIDESEATISNALKVTTKNAQPVKSAAQIAKVKKSHPKIKYSYFIDQF